MSTTPVETAIARWRESLPEELWQLRCWLVWKRVPKQSKPGKFDKVPYYTSGNIRFGANGGSQDREQLVELGDAILTFKNGLYSGIGMALLPEVPVWALDLDDCIDNRGELSALARRVTVSGTYCERSPSCGGVRALYAGRVGVDAKNHDAGVELFDSRGFVTVTGDRINGESLIACPQPLLAELVAIVKATTSRPGVGREDAPSSNAEVVRGIRLPLSTWQRLAHPYPTGCDRSAVAFSIALELRRHGLTREQAFELMANPDNDVLEPALERRRGDIASAREWLWRYVVVRAYQVEDRSNAG